MLEPNFEEADGLDIRFEILIQFYRSDNFRRKNLCIKFFQKTNEKVLL